MVLQLKLFVFSLFFSWQYCAVLHWRCDPTKHKISASGGSTVADQTSHSLETDESVWRVSTNHLTTDTESLFTVCPARTVQMQRILTLSQWCNNRADCRLRKVKTEQCSHAALKILSVRCPVCRVSPRPRAAPRTYLGPTNFLCTLPPAAGSALQAASST